VSDWGVVWLGVIAVAVAIMATVQIGLILVGLRLARQLSATAEEIRREVRPLLEKVHRVADEAARATSLVAVQAERLDRVMATAVVRVDEALAILRNAMGGPIRQGYALALALRAVFAAFRRDPARERTSREEEDALFVG
jgi:hypothetical protein